jgi:hypothetical protein
MHGRRRDQRFALSVPWEGALRLPGDVTIERWSEDEIWVVSASPARRDEVLTLDVTGDGPPMTLNVRVIDSTPVLVDDVVRHGLRLAIVGNTEGLDGSDTAAGGRSR